ncbi:MAG: hypothetical protein CMM44_10845 [Rhodospirillaceae bacterium]|nr:hypothetical protein [Rhodospirillaceae bacterium]
MFASLYILQQIQRVLDPSQKQHFLNTQHLCDKSLRYQLERSMKLVSIIVFFSIFFASAITVGRDHRERKGPPTRYHTATQTKPIKLEPSVIRLENSPSVTIEKKGGTRIIRSNGIPNHLVGRFPNCGNPHQIQEQEHNFIVPLRPRKNNRPTPLKPGMAFGVAINGVPFEPLAAEWFKGNRGSVWRYEALSGAVQLGPDESYAHVQPGGKYHYHGLPEALMSKENVTSETHSKVIGWAADGFPIYSLYGYSNKENSKDGIKELKSSYQLKSGKRSSDGDNPGGTYDGTFIADYEYREGTGDLDQCNGLFVSTPDFTNGTYAYFLTSRWPFIPRCFVGKPDESFNLRGQNRPRVRGNRPSDCPQKRRKHKEQN